MALVVFLVHKPPVDWRLEDGPRVLMLVTRYLSTAKPSPLISVKKVSRGIPIAVRYQF